MSNQQVSERMCRKFFIVASAGVLFTGTALAQSGMGNGAQTGAPNTGTQAPTSGMSSMDKDMASMNHGGGGDHAMTDKMFVHKALQGGMAEVELGQLALTKSSDPDVKKFAQQMVDDHTKMGEDMKAVATPLGVEIPKRLSKKDQAIKTKLEALDGAAFNKSYIKDMVKDHEDDEKEFKNESQMATIPEVKDAATKGEKVISMHLEMVKQVAQTVGVKSE